LPEPLGIHYTVSFAINIAPTSKEFMFIRTHVFALTDHSWLSTRPRSYGRNITVPLQETCSFKRKISGYIFFAHLVALSISQIIITSKDMEANNEL
jgi:hypothetical protein